jgi:hypothetical protein
MLSRVLSTFVIFLLVISIAGCASKPSKDQLHTIATNDFKAEYSSNKFIGDSFSYGLWGGGDVSIFIYLVGEEVEKNNDDMFPYKGTVYFLTSTGLPLKTKDDVANQLYHMDSTKLLLECKNADKARLSPHLNFLGSDRNAYTVNYKWWKKSKTWQKVIN